MREVDEGARLEEVKARQLASKQSGSAGKGKMQTQSAASTTTSATKNLGDVAVSVRNMFSFGPGSSSNSSSKKSSNVNNTASPQHNDSTSY